MTTAREIHDYVFSLLGVREGDPADNYKQVLQRLVDQGMEVNYSPNEQAKNRPDMPFRGVKVVKDASGAIRGTIQVPAHERDQNGFYTREYLLIRDRVQGQPPFVGPFDWGWDDRGGGTPYLLEESGTGGGDGGDGGDGSTGGGLTEADVQRMIDAAIAPLQQQLAEAVKYGDKLALECAKGTLLCAEGGGPEQSHEQFWLRSRLAVGAWESWKILRGV